MKGSMSGVIHFNDNIEVLKSLEKKSISLIYIDPPFNTGKVQSKTSIKTKKDDNGDRIGYQGNSYSTEILSKVGYVDKFDDFIEFLKPRLELSYDLLKDNGSIYFHIDYREVHYCKILLDTIFGRDCFLNEIIWAFDYGGRSKTKWSVKHNNILWYCKNPKDYIFNYESLDRLPYMSPGLVGPEKAAKGKTPTDAWNDISNSDFLWHTIVPTNSKERTKYPNQKPIGIINRIVKASSNEGDTVLDFFAGSGSTGTSCLQLNRNFILIDSNPEAIEVMKNRFKGEEVEFV